MHLLRSSIQPNMKLEGMNDLSACNPNLWNPPNTMRSLPTDKQAAFNWIDWGKKKQWCHVTQTLCTYMRVTNRLKITQRGLRQKMPGEDVFLTWERVIEPPGFDEKVHCTTVLVCLNETAERGGWTDQSSTGQKSESKLWWHTSNGF